MEDLLNTDVFTVFAVLCVSGIYGLYNTQISTPDQYEYRFFNQSGIPSPNRSSITFKVRACNDAHVALRSSDREPIEIVLGGWDNTASCLRTEIQGPCLSEYRGHVLDCGEFRTFKVYWGNGRIQVGNPTFCDALSVFLDLRLDYSLHGVEIGISTGFGASGEWIFKADREMETGNKSIYTPGNRKYRYLGNEGIFVKDDTSICFQVKACREAHVALMYSNTDPLEIILGGWGNSRSCIRRTINGTCLTEFRGRILNCEDFVKFVISWKLKEITVSQIFRNESGPILESIFSFKLNETIDVEDIGISTGVGTPGDWIFEVNSQQSNPRQRSTPNHGAILGVTLGILGAVLIVALSIIFWRKFHKVNDKKTDTTTTDETDNDVRKYESLQSLKTTEHLYATPQAEDNAALDYDYVKII